MHIQGVLLPNWYYTSYIFSRKLSILIKTHIPKCKIIWGGPYCFESYGKWKETVIYIDEVDVICNGDGDKDIGNLILQYEKNREFTETEGYFIRKKTDTENLDIGVAISDINKIPFADINIFDKDSYSWDFLPIIVSKGCFNRCTFCNEHLAHLKYQFREPEQIIAELILQRNRNHKIRSIWFTGSNIIGDIQKLKKLCNLIIDKKLNISWVSQLSINRNLTKDLFYLFQESGCKQLIYGIESGSNKVLRLMDKRYTAKEAKTILKNNAETSIGFTFNIIVGFPGESIWNFAETLFFVKRFQIYDIQPSVATCKILENSRIRNHYKDYNISNPKLKEWKTNDGKNTIQTRNLRYRLTKQIYESKILNLYFIPLKLHNHYLYIAENENKSILEQLFKWTTKKSGFALFYFSYLLFYFWLPFVFIKSLIVQNKSVNQHKKMSSNSIEQIKKKLITALLEYYSNSNNDNSTNQEFIDIRIAKFLELFNQALEENKKDIFNNIDTNLIKTIAEHIEKNIKKKKLVN